MFLAAIVFFLAVAPFPLCHGGGLNLHPAHYPGEAAEWKGIIRHILRLITLEAESVSNGLRLNQIVIYAMRLRTCFPGSKLAQNPHPSLRGNSTVQAWTVAEGDVVSKGSVLCTLANENRVEANIGGLVVKRSREGGRLVEILQFGEAHSTVDQEGMNGWSKTMRKLVFKLPLTTQHRLLDGIRDFHPDRLPTRQLVYPLIHLIIRLYSTELVSTAQLWAAYLPNASFKKHLVKKQDIGYRVRQLLVEEGDYVKNEQPLLAIDGGTVNAECSGIVASLSVKENEQLSEAQAFAEILKADNRDLRERRVNLSRAFSSVESKATDYFNLLTRFRAHIVSRFGHDTQRISEIEREYVGRLRRCQFKKAGLTLYAEPFDVVPAGRPLGWSGEEKHLLCLEIDCIFVGPVGDAVEVLVIDG